MIKFSDFMPVDFPDKTKVKFNMNAGNTALRAWDYLLDDCLKSAKIAKVVF